MNEERGVAGIFKLCVMLAESVNIKLSGIDDKIGS